jgi:hypothetical protein
MPSSRCNIDRRHQTDVSEAQLGLIALPGDVEDDVGAVPVKELV